MTYNIIIRNVQPSDIDAVFDIRNILLDLPDADKFFKNSKKLTPEKHARWFAAQLKPANRRNFFLAIQDDRAVGYLRYAGKENIYTVSIAVLPRFQKSGIGSQLLRQTLSKIERRGKQVQAEVRSDNIVSLKFFEKHGFIRLIEKDGYVLFARKL